MLPPAVRPRADPGRPPEAIAAAPAFASEVRPDQSGPILPDSAGRCPDGPTQSGRRPASARSSGGPGAVPARGRSGARTRCGRTVRRPVAAPRRWPRRRRGCGRSPRGRSRGRSGGAGDPRASRGALERSDRSRSPPA
ncbi:hypothetical protein TsocGM_05510 [Tautonia sociabilis]|uniref:Uncharacterized protein n=1 Tax=Tautonia sociabilis TaxID=2080755 RepID=A0A432MMZ1_9BACT|nr:hypothetical protein TsocGM_05510 [Tautonia sociabilis]